nr:MAG TPA: hypothetical protein [Caudoviricetes sp.]
MAFSACPRPLGVHNRQEYLLLVRFILMYALTPVLPVPC